MKILHLDIETSPNTAHVWGLFKQNVSISQLMDSSYVMCFAAKWNGEDEVIFKKHDEGMLVDIWNLLDQADAVVHYNGTKFDIPTLNKEFILAEMLPPSPYKQIDLLKVARQRFRFPSNKLDYVAKALGFDGKVSHWGHELWVRCMNHDEEAWQVMEEYNKQDVVLLEQVYKRMLPWITNHPNHALYGDTLATVPTCPNCGGSHLNKKGLSYTKAGIYQRYRCVDCGTPIRGRYQVVSKNENVLTQVS